MSFSPIVVMRDFFRCGNENYGNDVCGRKCAHRDATVQKLNYNGLRDFKHKIISLFL